MREGDDHIMERYVNHICAEHIHRDAMGVIVKDISSAPLNTIDIDPDDELRIGRQFAAYYIETTMNVTSQYIIARLEPDNGGAIVLVPITLPGDDEVTEKMYLDGYGPVC